jgi:hypothetical protein
MKKIEVYETTDGSWFVNKDMAEARQSYLDFINRFKESTYKDMNVDNFIKWILSNEDVITALYEFKGSIFLPVQICHTEFDELYNSSPVRYIKKGDR